MCINQKYKVALSAEHDGWNIIMSWGKKNVSENIYFLCTKNVHKKSKKTITTGQNTKKTYYDLNLKKNI